MQRCGVDVGDCDFISFHSVLDTASIGGIAYMKL